jgi:hypothetical protein
MPSDIERKQFMDEVVKPFFDNDLPKLRKHIEHLYSEVSRLKKGVDVMATVETGEDGRVVVKEKKKK